MLVIQQGPHLSTLTRKSKQRRPGRGAIHADNWLKRNVYWLAPLIALAALILGSGFGMNYLGLFVDGRIDVKLNEPLRRLRNVEDGITRIETKLDTLNDFLKPLITERLKVAAALFSGGDFLKTLPEVKAAVSLGRQQRVKDQKMPLRL